MDPSYTVKVESFEGPLDLLLSLIEKRKLFINDISLSKVADDYIAYVQTLGSYPVETTAHFILVASTLLLIKSKSLLPIITLTEEEQGNIEDLEIRLNLYKKFKELSQHIEKRFGKEIIFPRLPNKNIPIVFSPESDITSTKIFEITKGIIQTFPKVDVLPKAVIKKMVSLEDMIERLTERVKSSLKINFGDFAKTQGKTKHRGAMHVVSKEERVNIIVSFLAMLELVKQGIIDVSQNNTSDDIQIETQNLSVPNYH